MSTPLQPPEKLPRLSTKLCTPGSEFGRLTELNEDRTYTPFAQRTRFSIARNTDDSNSEGLLGKFKFKAKLDVIQNYLQ